ncbi:MAG TPA: hypothetical protein VFZ29_04830 [Solirubrobacterales bacterium]
MGYISGPTQGPLLVNSGETTVEEDLTGLKPGTEYVFRLVAENPDGQTLSAEPDPTFTTLTVDAPTVSIDAPSSVTTSSAHFSGTINPNAPGGNPPAYDVEWHFECTPACPGLTGTIPADANPHTVEADATDLKPGTAYTVALVATNAGGSATAGPESFSTPAVAPTVSDLRASALPSEATLEAVIDSGGAATSFHFEYGPTSAYGSSTQAQVTPAVAGEGPAIGHVAGLVPGQTYHYRLVASNSAGAVESPDQTFVTPTEMPSVPQVGPGLVPGKGFLPDGRGWEKVTPEDKGGVDVAGDSYDARTKVSADGNSIMYTSHGVFAGAPSGGYPSFYKAARGADGWTSQSLLPKSVASVVGGVGGGGRTAAVLFANDELTRWVVETNTPLGPGASEYVPNLYTRLQASDFRLLTPDGPSYQDALFFGAPDFRAALQDGEHIVFNSTHQFTPDAPAGFSDKLYESVDGVVRLVGILPDGTPMDKAFAGSNGLSTNHALSDDGRRLYFTDTYGGPGTVYLREDEQTVKVADDAIFYNATADGRYMVYRRIGATSTVFRYDAETGTSEEISVDSEPGDGEDPAVRTVLATSEDLSSVYFAAQGALLPGQEAVQKTPGSADAAIYLWRGGEVRLVATLRNVRDAFEAGPSTDVFVSPPRWNIWTSNPNVSWSPDGDVLAFATTAEVTGYDAEGYRQVYRYDADTSDLRCISCLNRRANGDSTLQSPQPPGGGTHARAFGPANYVSDDGRQVVFSSADALVPQDSNGKLDVYRWKEGEGLRLLSPGSTPFDSRLQSASPDGRDVFFATRARLSAGDQDDLVDLYDARVGGGWPDPPAVKTECASESCQGALQVAPEARRLGSSAIQTRAKTSRHRALAVRKRRVRLAPSGAQLLIPVTVTAAGTVRVAVSEKTGDGWEAAAQDKVNIAAPGRHLLKIPLPDGTRRSIREGERITLKASVWLAGTDKRTVVSLSAKRGR